ncbi:MAG: 1,4-alpha-glucan branching protein GlgB [Alphaproteobacteria bacterium]|jgi:1,4-alpha-glucan branching enzyme|nr:1,4-alpha-glucan branching protein GlgB [Alphaproteobacteria bacterium]
MATSKTAFDKAATRIAEGTHGDPFDFLGMHETGGELVVRTFQPQADSVAVIRAEDGTEVAALPRIHKEGVFAGPVGKAGRPFAYRLRVSTGGRTRDIADPYRFPPILGEMDLHLIAEGKHLRLDEKLGAHPMVLEGVRGTGFAVWAPNAERVSVVGDFNQWDGRVHAMRFQPGCGVWELFLPEIEEGTLYKYEVLGQGEKLMALKVDPFAFFCEQAPGTAGIVYDLSRYGWADGSWMYQRGESIKVEAPVSIYEVHLGSWRRSTEEGRRYLTYEELAETLIPYVRDMGFTHVELMPISEHPFDGSWGYQPLGLFAPTSRHGKPDEFRNFVDRCHQAGIGVINDWVPGHFPRDPQGLGWFDGTNLYEHADPRQGAHSDWGTLIYNYGRNEVSNYLLNNALFWIEEYHLDGLRVDAVASMLYLDYSRREGEWIPNKYGGNENLEAIEFLKRTNVHLYGEFPGVSTMAEESTSWPMVSRPTYLGGLGFGYKWNMGWMHDTLSYMSKEPVYRKYHHDQLTHTIVYAFAENFVLPLSHDEVVHGKGSLLGKMPGDRWQKFANLRAYYGLMFGYPGKKLLFMGCEFGQEREWNHDAGLDWHLLDDPLHAGLQGLVRDLNTLYRGEPALHSLDCEGAGFEWIDTTDWEKSVISFLRKGRKPGEVAVVVCNFTPVVRENYRIGVPQGGLWRERINTDAGLYGGSNVGNAGAVIAQGGPHHGRPHMLELTLPPLGTVIFVPDSAGA